MRRLRTERRRTYDGGAVTGRRLSESKHGQEWLENFPASARGCAAMLVDAVRIVSSDAVRAELTAVVDSIVGDDAGGLTALYPVYDLRRDREPVEPNPVRLRRAVGSNQIIHNVSRSITQHEGKRRARDVLLAPSRTILRDRKVSRIVLIDDIAGSGDQATAYLDAWWRDRTVRSWSSLKYVSVHYVAITICSSARRRIEEHPLVDAVHTAEPPWDLVTAPWSDAERDDVKELCLQYAAQRSLAFGYGGVAGLCVLHHTVPNTLPAVLTQRRGRANRSWTPMFAHSLSAEQLQLGDYWPLVVSRVGAASSPRLTAATPSAQQAILVEVLVALRDGFRTELALATLLRVSLAEAMRYRQLVLELGLADVEGRLTDRGREEVRSLRRARIRPVPPPPSSEPYYPTSLGEPV
jgi:hypothetical protein